MQYSFYVSRGLFDNPQVLRHLKQELGVSELNLDIIELNPNNGREIREVYKLSYDPCSRIRGKMTREQAGNLVERLFGVGGLSVAVISNREIIMTRTNGEENGKRTN